MCIFFISHTRRIKYCRYYSIPLHDAMNVILKHRRFLDSCCFKVEITGSILEENVRISHAIILQRVHWAIAMCTFCIFGQIFPLGTQMRGNLPKSVLAVYQNIVGVAGERNLYPFVQELFQMLIPALSLMLSLYLAFGLPLPLFPYTLPINKSKLISLCL